MRIHAIVRVTVDIDQDGEAAFRQAAAATLAARHGRVDPDDFDRKATSSRELALCVVLGGIEHGESLVGVMEGYTGARLSGLACSPQEMRRDDDDDDDDDAGQLEQRRKALGLG